jgi:CRP-like cAMP-binding protein
VGEWGRGRGASGRVVGRDSRFINRHSRNVELALSRDLRQVMAKAKFDIDAIPAGEDKILRFLNGGVVFIKGGVGEHAYLVKSGKVEIREAGRAVESMEPGELFGEMALIDSELRGSSGWRSARLS